MAKKINIRFYYFIPVIIALIFGSANLLSSYRVIDKRLYDLFLHIKPPLEEDESILLLNIDDLAIAQVGTWPWPRSVVGDGLLLLREFGASTVVFDIEYVDRSPQGVDTDYLETVIPRLLTDRLGEIDENVSSLFTAIIEGYIPIDEAEGYVEELSGITGLVRDELLDAIRLIARDNDDYLGRAVSFFGNTWATVNMLPDEIELVRVSDEHRLFVRENIAMKNVTPAGYVPVLKAPTVQPAVMPILTRAAGAGYPNVVVDDDGVRRRIDLAAEYADGYYSQLVFGPLRKKLGTPELILEKNRVVLKNAEYSDGTRKDIVIPLSHDGRMLVNWPAKMFDESFRHLSFNDLVIHGRLEKSILRNLTLMEEAGYLDFHESELPVMDVYRYVDFLLEQLLEEAGRKSPESSDIEEYIELRKNFFEELSALTDGRAEAALLAEIDRILRNINISEELHREYQLVREDVISIFRALKTDLERLLPVRERLSRELPGSFIIIGHTGISTTDIGVNPFEKEYMNVGTHAAVANTILTGNFLIELHWMYGAFAGLVLAFFIALVIKNLKPLPSVLIGLGFLAGTLIAGALIFIITGVFLPVMTPLITLFLTFISISLIKFLKTEGEKSFLRSAFGRYLSQDVISQIIADPDRLNLGGEKKELTAVFTDVKGFSTISEKLDPADLVKLLNYYLTGMSNTILDMQGTIDKYEGDAIIAFFGAPINFEDHAYRACMSAVQMKRVEKELNQRFLSEQLTPAPLLTRVGINTGDMVVGNMGTPQKMDYTIMGNAVNLAARLEGVNKQYGTWILMSQITKDQAGDHFLTRELDRVRVMGINQPVRLYELVDEKTAAGKQVVELLDIFREGLTLFEAREWKKANDIFIEALRLDPEDGPSETFRKRCQEYLKKPPTANWDGVFTLGTK